MKDTTRTQTIEVINDDGRTFTVRVLTDEPQTVVEFYDKTYIESLPTSLRRFMGFTPLGKFVSRYYYETLVDALYSGINLDGGVDAWHVSAENVQDALAFAYTVTQEVA